MANPQSEWQKLLYGPKNIFFNPQPVNFGNFAEPEVPEVSIPENDSGGGGGYTGGDGGGSEFPGMSEYEQGIAQRNGTPLLTDPAFWGGQWSPDITARDVFGAYGKYMGNPLTGGFAMAKAYMNPTKDPLVQKALGQYLQEFAPNMSLDQVLKEINTLYAANPSSKVNALDTIAGYALGLGPLASQYQSAVLSGIMAPHEFAQQARVMGWVGLDPMQNKWAFDVPTQFHMDPTTGVSTYNSFERSPLSNLAQAYISSMKDGTLGRSTQNHYRGGIYTSAGDMLADAMAESQRSSIDRQLSREWMGEVLSGRTNQDFGGWKESIGDRWGGGDYSGGFGEKTSSPQSGFGTGWQGGYQGQYGGGGWSSADMDRDNGGEGGSDNDHDSGFSDAPGGNMEGGFR